MTNTKEYRMEIKVKNNLLYKKIYDTYGSVKSFCNAVNLSDQTVTKFLVKYYASNHSPLPIEWFMSDKKHYLGAEKGFGIIETFYDNGQSFKILTQYLEETGLKCYLYAIAYPIGMNGSMNICLDIYPEYETEEKIENIKTLMALLFK